MTTSKRLEKIQRKKSSLLSPNELAKTVFGRFSSDRDDLSINRKAILKKKLRAKLSH